MHACPELISREAAPNLAECLRFAPGRTINGSDPPSSRQAFFRCLPESSAMCLPTSVDPVKLTPLTCGEDMTFSVSWLPDKKA